MNKIGQLHCVGVGDGEGCVWCVCVCVCVCAGVCVCVCERDVSIHCVFLCNPYDLRYYPYSTINQKFINQELYLNFLYLHNSAEQTIDSQVYIFEIYILSE